MFTEEQIKKLAPKESTFKAGKKLSAASGWSSLEKSERALWGSIQGSGKKAYLVQIDTSNLAYKCTCPSRQFPCKHALGLLLVQASSNSAFSATSEPDYVTDWIDKREKRAQKDDSEDKEQTEEEIEKKSSAKAKRQDDRLKLTQAGVAELKLWLKDLIRIGLLELPNRTHAYFDTVIERMVDSKANGLAGWVRALKTLNFKEQDTWQTQALEIISKLFLLIRAAENLDSYSDSDQLAIKSLLGWTFTQKDMIANEDTITKKDHWLVLGSHIEIQDDLTIFRYWLQGLQSGQDALILQFENKFSNQANTIPILEGSVIEAELGFYPGLLPHRAFIKKQKEVHPSLYQMPDQIQSWSAYQSKNLTTIKQDPWANNRSGFIEKVKIIKNNQSLIAIDINQNYKNISDELDEDKQSTLLLFSNNQYVSMAFVDQQDSILPLGLLQDRNYSVL